jgi:hypothetical protein
MNRSPAPCGAYRTFSFFETPPEHISEGKPRARRGRICGALFGLGAGRAIGGPYRAMPPYGPAVCDSNVKQLVAAQLFGDIFRNTSFVPYLGISGTTNEGSFEPFPPPG